MSTITEVVGLDRPGIVANVSAELDAHNVEILSLDTLVEQMQATGMSMFRSKMTLCLSEDAAAEFEFQTREEEREELEKIVHNVEQHLDHDIQLRIVDTV